MASYSWTGNISGFWSNPGNWTPSGLPGNGDSLTFGSGASNKATTNDTGATSFYSIRISDSGYTLSGGSINIIGSPSYIQDTSNTGLNTIASQITGSSTIVYKNPNPSSLLDSSCELDLSGTSNSFGGGVLISRGIVKGTTLSAFGTGIITLGASGGTFDCTLVSAAGSLSNPINNNITTSAITSGTLKFDLQNSAIYTGSITLIFRGDLKITSSDNGGCTFGSNSSLGTYGKIDGPANLTIVATGQTINKMAFYGNIGYTTSVGNINIQTTNLCAVEIDANVGCSGLTATTTNISTNGTITLGSECQCIVTYDSVFTTGNADILIKCNMGGSPSFQGGQNITATANGSGNVTFNGDTIVCGNSIINNGTGTGDLNLGAAWVRGTPYLYQSGGKNSIVCSRANFNFDTVVLAAGSTWQITHGTTQTVNNLISQGTAGSNATITSDTTATAYLSLAASSTKNKIQTQYLTVQYCTALYASNTLAGVNVWYAGVYGGPTGASGSLLTNCFNWHYQNPRAFFML